ncbi:uncharacterized protein [Coffea arabica]|uniref:Uncharacterized protein isoform X5 n=1 Tax=Coffea arabica TaxID=13443 RepID=A0ABM4X4F3_COFAR
MTLVAGIWVQMTRRGFPFIPTFLVVVALRASKWLFGLYVLSCVVGVFWKELCFPTCILEGRLFRRMWNFKFCNTGFLLMLMSPLYCWNWGARWVLCLKIS